MAVVGRTFSAFSEGPRVVALTLDAALCAEAGGGVGRVVRVASPYEAAAELLAAPAAALLIDLRALPVRHLRLLEIARDLSVEVLAFGPLPAGMTSDDLSGVRLLSRQALGE
jgi:hypothetical protein